MGGEAGEEGSRTLASEMGAGDGGSGQDGVAAEPGEKQRMVRDVDERSEDVGGEVGPAGGEGFHESAPGGAIGAEVVRGGFEVLGEESGGSVFERVGERGGGVDPLQPVALELERVEKGRANAERMDGGADVVMEAGERELKGAAGAACSGLGLVDVDFEASLSEDDGGGETVGAGADDCGFHAG